MISTAAPRVPSGLVSREWVKSACQRSLGCSASNRCQDERGRFCGWGVTNPRRVRIRQIVEIYGGAVAGEVGDLGV